MRRGDSLPAPKEREVLEGIAGIAQPVATPSPRYQLALEVRRLNARLSQLPPDAVAALQKDWMDDFDAMQAEREDAPDRVAELQVVERWANHWAKRLR